MLLCPNGEKLQRKASDGVSPKGPTLPLMKEMAAEWEAFDYRKFEKELNG